MRQVREVGKWNVVGGAVVVMDTMECPDWTTCERKDKHVHGTMTVSGPNVPQFTFAETGISHSGTIMTMGFMAAGVITFS